MTSTTWIKYGFLAAGLANVLGIPVFSKLFTNTYLMKVDHDTFSWVSLIAIMLWGLAYLSVSGQVARVPGIAAVFAIEKFFYTAVWAIWIWKHHAALPDIYSKDVLTGFFYSVYGINDFLFGVVFLCSFIHLRKADNNGSEKETFGGGIR